MIVPAGPTASRSAAMMASGPPSTGPMRRQAVWTMTMSPGARPSARRSAASSERVWKSPIIPRLIRRRGEGQRHFAGRFAIEQPGGLEIGEARQVAARGEVEMRQERRRRGILQRPARRFAAAGGADPAGLHQHVDGAAGHGDAADFLDFGAGDGLVIGDDRQRLDGGAGEFLAPPRGWGGGGGRDRAPSGTASGRRVRRG